MSNQESGDKLAKNFSCKFKLVLVWDYGNLVNVNYFVIEIKVSNEVPAVYCLTPVIPKINLGNKPSATCDLC